MEKGKRACAFEIAEVLGAVVAIIVTATLSTLQILGVWYP